MNTEWNFTSSAFRPVGIAWPFHGQTHFLEQLSAKTGGLASSALRICLKTEVPQAALGSQASLKILLSKIALPKALTVL